MGSLHQTQADIKVGPAGWEKADLGTKETQRDMPSLKRWSLLLLLLGLARPPATSAQAYSYQEAVLRAVDGFNQRSKEANLYRLLELDPQLQQVSWGAGGGGLCSHQAQPHCHAGPLVGKALLPLSGGDPSPRKPSLSHVPSQRESCQA